MPAQQALTEARKRVGPSYGDGGGADAFRERLEETAAFLAPPALLVPLALTGGGFLVSERHVAGLAVWLLVVILLALGAASRATLAKPFYWAGGLIAALALFSAFSSLWSGSIELSVTEADRVLVYLGVLVAAFLIAQTEQRRQRFGEGIAVAIIAIAVVALGSRLFPHFIAVDEGLGSGARLRFPLGYWNANAVLFALGSALCLWLSRRSLFGALRWIAVGSLPILLVALYVTYSRGGLLALAISCLCLVALSHDRLWLLGALGAGAIGAVPAVLAIQDRTALADNVATPHVVGQGVAVSLYLLAGIVLSLLLFWGLRALERRGGARTGRAVALSRDRRVLGGLAIAAAVVAIGVAIAVGGRAWNQFSNSDYAGPANPSEHFSELNGAGRDEFFRVALHAFGEKPLEGTGAGTYRFSWDRLRHEDITNQVAHSLYLQAFSELGVVGGVLVLAIVLLLLWTGFSAWRRAQGTQRELFAVLFAVSLAFAVVAAIDWFWEIAALGSVFFLAGGVLLAGRCAQLARRRAADGAPQQRRFGIAVVGLAVAWITILALVGPLLVEHELESSKESAREGDIAGAVEDANTAKTIEPWAASPYIQLGLLSQAQGDYTGAVSRFDQAIDREDRNWTFYYLRGKAEHEGGNPAAARADLAKARELNPLEPCLAQGWDGCG